MKKWLIGIPLFLFLFLGVLIAVYLNAAREAELTTPVQVQVDESPTPGIAPEPDLAPAALEAMASKKQELEQELAEARRELTGLRLRAATVPTDPPTTNPAPDTPASFMESFASMLDSPDMKEAIKAQSRMALDQTHGEFFRGMELPADVQRQLKDLLVERNLSAMSTGLRAWREEGIDAENAENAKEAMDLVNGQIRELLGDDDYALFERFEETQTERMQVDMFKERLSGELAIDWETQDRLIEAMANARLAAPPSEAFESMSSGESLPTAEMMGGVIEYMDEINTLYLEEAAAILDQEQFAVFQESLEQYATMQKAGMKMAEAMFGKQDETEAEE